MSCAGIFSGGTVSCSDPLAVGIEQRLFLANLNDIEVGGIAFDTTDNNLITGITMKSGKTFFEFEGLKQSISFQEEVQQKPFSTGYKLTVDFSVFDVSASQRRNLEAMVFQPQIAILFGPNDSSLSNGFCNVLGVDVGLDVITSIRIPADNETGGAYRVQLATPDAGGIETGYSKPMLVTDYAATLAAVVALKS
jgi:hypothetical protein